MGAGVSAPLSDCNESGHFDLSNIDHIPVSFVVILWVVSGFEGSGDSKW
jgi:hypothetical protein